MISSEGYKAFRGTMRITPKNPNMKPFDLTCDWLYKPEYQCWYGKGSSFMEEICTVLVDLTAPLPNTPLTLEEFRKMDGEPVFVTSSIGEQPMWYIVDVEENELKNPWDRITLEGWDEGYPYKAYRRKPEEAAPPEKG